MSSSSPAGLHAGTESTRSRFNAWQFTTIALLFAGYAAYYFCRSDLSVAMPMLVDYLRQRGMTSSGALIELGAISSFGVVTYAFGKLFLTGLGDLWGGKRAFVSGMGGALAFTILFALGGGIPVFTLAWIGNRLSQSIGWAGLVKVCSKWFSYTAYGTVIGVLSLSFLVGDAAARQFMGMLIQHGYGWRRTLLFRRRCDGRDLRGQSHLSARVASGARTWRAGSEPLERFSQHPKAGNNWLALETTSLKPGVLDRVSAVARVHFDSRDI